VSATIARFSSSVAFLLACLALAAPAPALAAGERASDSPSAERLWQAYPLEPRTQATDTPGTPGTRERTPAPRGSDADETPVPLALVGELLLILAGITLGGGAAVIARRRARAPSESAAAPAAAAPLPSDPQRGWTAEIEWRASESDSSFWVLAAADDGSGRTPVAQSAALEWPPSGPTAVQALSDAAGALEEALLSAGWAPLPAGDAWYAKRFRWEPRPRPGSARLRRRTDRVAA
jgi:hypothetical protein